MIGHLAYAEGAPCPTFVLDAARVPMQRAELLGYLADARRQLIAVGGGHVLKIALVAASTHPSFDLDYRFVQALPGGAEQFDWRGSCGHSVLASVVSSARAGMLAPLTVGARIRVRVLNNGDGVVCEVERVERAGVEFTVHFVRTLPVAVEDLLPTGAPRTVVTDGERRIDVSLVTSGNPYVFVDAREVGLPDEDAMRAAGPDAFATLERVRVAAGRATGRPVVGAFPKIAAVLPVPGGLFVRAVSVPGWHPTVALTGAVCLATAARIDGSIVAAAAAEAGCADGPITLHTPGAVTTVAAHMTAGDRPRLAWTTVRGKNVAYHGSFVLASTDGLDAADLAQSVAASVRALPTERAA